MGSQKTVVVKGLGVRYEAITSAAVTPGHLVVLESTGKIKAHATSDGWAEKAFAVENDLQGENISTAYSSGDLAQYEIMTAGCVVNALIKNGEAIAIGDKLISAGDGTLKEASSEIDFDSIIGVAVEACDMSGSSAVDPSNRCLVRIV
jgi:hypothetical protein